MPLDGVWYNELGSRMELRVTDGQVEGTYETAVSETACAQGRFALAGRADTAGDALANVGFVVSWVNDRSNCASVTAWSGEYHRTASGAEAIKTTWLLTVETKQADDWKSTLVGQDVFTRTRPAAEQLAAARAMKRMSHPT